MGIELAKTNLYAASGPPSGVVICKTNMYVGDDGDPEQPTVEGRVHKAGMQVPASGVVQLQVSKASAQVAFEFTSRDLQVTQASYALPVEQDTTFRVGKAAVQVVCRGRPELAYVRAWTFTLDGHDYYVLQLQELTLVYDLHSETWYNWGTGSRELWRGQIGVDWNANLGKINGGLTGLGATNIIVGDYANGALYFLNTGLAEDTDPDGGPVTLPFHRVVYGQIPVRGHNYVACNSVELAGSIGETSGSADMTVKLRFSDDAGHNFVDAGAIEISPSQYSAVVQWPSLGSFRGPGRLFRIEDWGALARIDGLDMNDGTEADG